ncbi:MAG: DUF1385 domain-containing protein [Chloroflexota bacterium]|nr:DUF1385 domain-containing protein [Chloroflexota bacterium]
MPIYGGQAVIEGVMMRSRSSAATAVRAVDGSIVVREMPLRQGNIKRSLRRFPVARGIAALWDVFALGTRSLAFSARMATVDPDADESDVDESDIWTKVMMALGLGLGVVLFFMAPLGLTALIDRWIDSSTVSNLIEGFIRVVIVIGYLAAIGLLPDIYRTLQYHGAEHKTVNAVESRVQLTPGNVVAQSRFHPRCGTSFLLMVVIISIIGFALLGRPDIWLRIGSRLVMIPIAAGIAFEVITFLASRRQLAWAKALAAPGIWLQRLTTRHPDLEQCEVAIAAIAPVLAETDRDLLVGSVVTALDSSTAARPDSLPGAK